MTTDRDYEGWLRANPAPDLQELVERHGGYDKITPAAWAEYDRAMADWQERRRNRSQGGPSEEIPQSDCAAPDPAALCICGLPGVVSRPRKGGGRPIWRCEQHRDRWPDYAAEVYDAADDFSRSLDACYAAIRERVARGGEGWTPPTKSFPESSKLRASGARGASGALKQMAAPLGDAAEEVTGGYENHTTR
jgi:hypothetical protein